MQRIRSEGAGTGFGDRLVLLAVSAADTDPTDDLPVAHQRMPPAKIITRPWLETWMAKNWPHDWLFSAMPWSRCRRPGPSKP